MTGAFLRAKRDGGFEPVEVEYLTPGERRGYLMARPPEELMNWMDLLCEKLVYAEGILNVLVEKGLLEKPEP